MIIDDRHLFRPRIRLRSATRDRAANCRLRSNLNSSSVSLSAKDWIMANVCLSNRLCRSYRYHGAIDKWP